MGKVRKMHPFLSSPPPPQFDRFGRCEDEERILSLGGSFAPDASVKFRLFLLFFFLFLWVTGLKEEVYSRSPFSP